MQVWFAKGGFYQPEVFEDAMAGTEHAWLPVEWQWYRASGRRQRGECCGVFGGNRIDFIQHYAGPAIRLIEERGNQDAWQRIQRRRWHNHEFEQYLLAACIEYHRGRTDSPYRDVAIDYVFCSTEDAFNPETAARAGYTHLIADAKCNRQLADRLEARVAADYPEQYRRCCAFTQPQGRKPSRRSRKQRRLLGLAVLRSDALEGVEDHLIAALALVGRKIAFEHARSGPNASMQVSI